MGLFSKDIAAMDDLLLHGLKDIYRLIISPKRTLPWSFTLPSMSRASK
jgi:hypothetical protein